MPMTGNVPFKLYRPLALGVSGTGVNTQTLSGTFTMTDLDEQFQDLDGGVANRNVVLPPANVENKGVFFIIRNRGTTNNFAVKDVASTITTVDFGEQCIVGCNGANWKLLLQTSGLADLTGIANTWAALQTFTTGILIQDSGTVGFGTPGTDLVLTANGTDTIVTGTGDLVFVDNVDVFIGTGKDIGFKWDAVDLIVSQALADSVIKWGVSGAGINHLFYGDTAGRNMSWDQTNDQLIFDDSAFLGLGTGAGAAADIRLSWDGTRCNVTQLTVDSEIRWGVDGAGLDQRWYGDTASAFMLWDQSQDARIMGGVAVDLKTQAGTGTGTVIEVEGPDLTHGMKRVIFEATIATGAIENAILTIPAMSVVDVVQANVDTALTGGGTTATFSIGITGDVDKYGTAGTLGAQADLLAQNSKVDCFGTRGAVQGGGIGVFVAAAQDVKLIGAAAGGVTAGDTALTVGTVKVRVVYRTLMQMANA